MKLLKISPFKVVLYCFLSLILLISGLTIFVFDSDRVEDCAFTVLDPIFDEHHNPFIYEISAKDIENISIEELEKFKNDPRKEVADAVYYKDNKITLGLICEGCKEAEKSFGYKKIGAVEWCNLNLFSQKVEDPKTFYEKISQL